MGTQSWLSEYDFPLMSTDTPDIVQAILSGDSSRTEQLLSAGVSSNQLWGSYALVTHAALIPSLSIFRLLVNHGALIPEDFLRELITWELGDWRINGADDETQLVEIINHIRSTKAWLPSNERRRLASFLDGYKLPNLTDALISEVPTK